LRVTVTETLPEDIKTLKAAIDAINASDRLLLTCHVKPDGDALGSLLGLGLALKDAGKDVTFFIEDPAPDTLQFLPGSQYLVNEVANPLPEETTLVVLDCNEPHRIGKQAQRLIEQASLIVVLDHHLSQIPFCADPETKHPNCISYIFPDIFAAGAIVLWIIKGLGWPITEDIATNLYAAILSDTGCFRHSNTNETAFRMAGDLVAHGANPYAVANKLYQNYPLCRQHLLGLVLRTIELKRQGKIGLLQAAPEMFRISGATEHDTDDFVGYVRCIDTVEVAIFIKEIYAGQVSVSLRSKSFFNVAKLAKEFGGGGHFHAAGFRKTGTAAEIREILLNKINAYFEDSETADA
jgi:phosphoesterase RecJ-like protein